MDLWNNLKFWKRVTNGSPTMVDACVSTEGPPTCDVGTIRRRRVEAKCMHTTYRIRNSRNNGTTSTCMNRKHRLGNLQNGAMHTTPAVENHTGITALHTLSSFETSSTHYGYRFVLCIQSHCEPTVQQRLICGSFQNTQDTSSYLATYQGLVENRTLLKLSLKPLLITTFCVTLQD